MSIKNVFFHCDYCNIDCCSKRVFTNHIKSCIHIQNVNSLTQNKTQIVNSEIKTKPCIGLFVCEYCNAEYKYKKNYNRHFQKCEKKDNIIAVTKDYAIPNEVMDSFIKSWKQNPVGIGELAKHNFEPRTSSNGNNIQNNIQTNNHIAQQTVIDNSNQTINHIVQNNTINIMPFGKEDLSTLTEDVRKAIYCRGFSSFEELINELYKNVNNINIYISNKRDGTVKFINDKMEIEIGDIHDAVEKIVESKKDILEDILDEFRGTQNIHAETRIKKLDKAHSNCERDEEYSKLSRKKLIQITPIGKQNLKKIESMK